jgi:hypothetical protein
MSVHAYLFEAKSIQEYLMVGGKLADMVAASELVEQLTGDILDEVLAAVGLQEGRDIHFSRRAGGACSAIVDDEHKAKALRDLMAIFVPNMLPGLEFIQCVAEGDSDRLAIKKGIETLSQIRNVPLAKNPLPGPLVMRAPRTGEAVVENRFVAGGAKEWVDTSIKIRRDFDGTRYAAGKLSGRFAPSGETINPKDWPRDLQGDSDKAFPFKGDDKHLAILHVDGNGLGQIVITLSNLEIDKKDPLGFQKLYREFSEGLRQATEGAAQEATRLVLLPAREEGGMMPARPMILGGDDLTIIVRADLAIDFAREFIAAFEEKTAIYLKAFKKTVRTLATADAANQLPDYLTACGGLVIQKSSQPFSLGYKLAENLCEFAKDSSREAQAVAIKSGKKIDMPSSLAFHRVTSSWSTSRDDVAEQEYLVRHGQETFNLSLGAYAIGQVQSMLPRLTDLQALVKVVENARLLQMNGVRQMASQVHLGKTALKQFERRLAELDSRQDDCHKQLKGIRQAADKLFPGAEKREFLFFNDASNIDDVRHAPLADLLCLSKGGKQDD